MCPHQTACYYCLAPQSCQNQYWSDPRPLIKEAGQLQAMKRASEVDSAYTMMGALASEREVETMMEGAPQETTLQGFRFYTGNV